LVCYFAITRGSETTVFSLLDGHSARRRLTRVRSERARSDRVEKIDTTRCRLFMLTGEYDYSCTTEMSAAAAAKIPGARLQSMPGIGHFLFAENPRLFADYLLPILATPRDAGLTAISPE